MQKVVILGTGGTIAGTASDATRPWAYQAATVSVSDLVAGVPALAGLPIEVLQVAQVDSKDMSWSVWQALGHALWEHLARPDVAGVVITHGSDTLEETAYWLQQLVDGAKPIVLTAAMRPATAADADGPRNLADAVGVAFEATRRGLGGVVVVLDGHVWAADQVRKSHTTGLDAFDAGGASPMLVLGSQGQWTQAVSPWPRPGAQGWSCLQAQRLPRVEILHNHAGADGWIVNAMLAQAEVGDALRGIVVACTGHGTVSEPLAQALRRAVTSGVLVWRSTRVARGGVVNRDGDEWPACGAVTPAQARVALMLSLMQAR